MKRPNKTRSGFTLIELMVVISVITFMSSVVFSALGNARAKAKDSVIRQEVLQLANLLELEYLNTRSYAGGWTWLDWVNTTGGTSGTANDCNYSAWFTSVTYGSKMREICDKIVKNETGSNLLLIWPTNADNSQVGTYRIMVKLPSNGAYYVCKGNNGKSSVGDPSGWTAPGCYLDLSQ
ncbi:MAG: type II secretion system protein [Patescibacteria group bacterium]